MQLVLLAAGLGTRFGGPKQFFPVGPSGECLYHYSVAYCNAIFKPTSLIMVTRKEVLEQAQSSLKNIPIPTQIVLQQTHKGKPRGTADALLTALQIANPIEPLIILNADDFYGPESFQASKTLTQDLTTAAAVPYLVKNTLSPHGGVSRAICKIQNNFLTHIQETHQILRTNTGVSGQVSSTPIDIPLDTPVSMNFFLFNPEIKPNLQAYVAQQFQNSPSAEVTIPDFLQSMITNHQWNVPVATSTSEWFGMTFPEDRLAVQKRLIDRYEAGERISELW